VIGAMSLISVSSPVTSRHVPASTTNKGGPSCRDPRPTTRLNAASSQHNSTHNVGNSPRWWPGPGVCVLGNNQVQVSRFFATLILTLIPRINTVWNDD
jgi:hypothetical protein